MAEEAARGEALSNPTQLTLTFSENTMRAILWVEWFAAGFFTALRALALAIATPLLEKNAAKVVVAKSLKVSVMFSMARVIVLAFAIAMLHQSWRAGIAGWPEATLSITIVLAMPILGALEHSRPAEVISLAKALVGRFGIGETRRGVGRVIGSVPSKYDDHRNDGASDSADEDERQRESA